MRSLKAAVFIAALVALHPFVFERNAQAADDISTVKSLYASASYEEALTELASIDATDDAELIEQYRALCLLALDRTGEAERSLERIILRKPLYRIADTDVSPKLVTMFHEVRKRTLPASARDLYAKARADYENERFTSAADQFQQVLMIVKDPDAADRTSSLAELAQLAEGFLTLTRAELAASKAAAAAVVASVASVAVTPPGRPPVIYTAADKDVTPPLDLERSLPPWTPPPGLLVSRMTLRGTLELLIDDRGAVEAAALREPITSFYDSVLLAAAKRWIFRPATRQGKPVKYRQSIEIVLQPRGQ